MSNIFLMFNIIDDNSAWFSSDNSSDVSSKSEGTSKIPKIFFIIEGKKNNILSVMFYLIF